MYQSIAARNERRNRRRAVFMTSLITGLLMVALAYFGSPDLQAMVDGLVDQVLGTEPTANVQP
jgi:amino acid transporter